MQLKFKFGPDGLNGVWFDGLDGQERVTSVSQVLTKLRVRNPAVVFTEDAKAGLFDKVSDKEYNAMLHSVECIAMLWRYKGDRPTDKSTRPEMNVLTLLANAVELISRQNIELEKLRDTPDFAPEPADEETLAEIEEAVGRKQAMDAWERLLSSGEEPELDDFGNPIVEDKDGDAPDWEDVPDFPDDPGGEVPGGDANSDNKLDKPIRK